MDPVTASLLGSVGSTVLGGLFGSSSAKKANKAAAREAERNRAFQREAMQNQYQWQAADLEKAGLNRILALGGSLGIPGGAQAPVMSESGEAVKGVSSAVEAMLAKETVNNIKQDTKLKKDTAYNQYMQGNAAIEQKHLAMAQQKLTAASARKMNYEGDILKPDAIINSGPAGISARALERAMGAAGNVTSYRGSTSKSQSKSDVTSRSNNTNNSTSRSEVHTYRHKGD